MCPNSQAGMWLEMQQKVHHCFTEQQRESLFHSFWQLESLERQRDYISRHVSWKKKRCNGKGRIKSRCQYEFSVDGTRIVVCKIFFLHTYSVSERMIMTTSNEVTESGHVLPEGRRLPSAKRVALDIKKDIRSHIRKFPTVDSHYCRQSSKRQYLPQELTLNEMYRMYLSECVQSNKKAGKKWLYYEIFNKAFNCGFFRPKKDQCDFCLKYEHMDEMSRADLEDKMKDHLRNKTLVRQVKDEVKELAKADEKINAACFDLQQVLTTPKSMSSQLYYRRKLSTFNLTVFNLARKHGSCYMWHEGVGKRGANNIASCVWQYMHTASSHGAKEFHFFTDKCKKLTSLKLIVRTMR